MFFKTIQNHIILTKNIYSSRFPIRIHIVKTGPVEED